MKIVDRFKKLFQNEPTARASASELHGKLRLARNRLHDASEGVKNLEISESPWGGPSQELRGAQQELKSAKAEVRKLTKQLNKLGAQPEAHAAPPQRDSFEAHEREPRARFAPRPAEPVVPPAPPEARDQASALHDLLHSNGSAAQLSGLQRLSPRLLRELEQQPGSAGRRDPRLEALLVAASRPGPARVKARLRLHPDKLHRLTSNLSPAAKAELEGKANTL